MESNSGKAQLEALLQLIQSATYNAIAEYETTGYGVPRPGDTQRHHLDDSGEAFELRKAVRILESACERLCTTLAQPMHTLINRSMSFEAPCIQLATSNRIADILQDAPEAGMHVNDIATKAKLAPEKLRQVLLLLATRGCFTEVSKDVYINNRLSLALLSSNPVSAYVAMMSGDLLHGATAIPEALVHPEYAFSTAVDKTPFSYLIRNEMSNATFYEWYTANPEKDELFQRGLKGANRITGSTGAATKVYPWEAIMPVDRKLTFCDVGSGVGTIGLALARAYPSRFKFVLQDLHGPLKQAEKVWSEEHEEIPAAGGQSEVVDFVPLDFLNQSPVPNQDIYFMGHIIHNWPDSEARTILRNVAKAMSTSSRILIHDIVLYHPHHQWGAHQSKLSMEPVSSYLLLSAITVLKDEQAPEPLLPNYGTGNIFHFSQSINMLASFNSRERTVEEFVELGEQAGLELIKIWALSTLSLLEFKLAVDNDGTS
ncbi:hypothetical protein V5O48_010657 [Marasmius crinis-equi]|uniref:O-methyltransferase C-terminal domain-containing protein n=1 Tax=Marasmius crinis-equi TaxID=585013 RepID=A0ABR3F7R1_9AGAR